MKFEVRARFAATALAAIALVGCGGKSEPELVKAAQAELAAGRPAEALLQLKTALQTHPNSPQTRLLMGRTLLQTGDAAAAAVELQKALELGAGADEAVPLLAESMLGSGQAKAMLNTYGATKLTSPQAVAALKASTAAARLVSGQTQQGEDDVRAALAADPANLAANLLQARLLAGRRSFDEALALVDKQVTAHPRSAEVVTLKGELLWAGKQDAAGAIAAFKAALAIGPRYLPAHTGLLGLLLEQRDVPGFQSALAALKKAHPNLAETRFYDAREALLAKNIARAREAIQQLLVLTPDNPYVLQLAGAIEFEGGALVPAEARLTKALGVAPQLATARQLLAQTHLRAGQPAKAIAVLRPLLEQTPPSAAALALTAQAHLQAGNAGQAEQFYLQAAKADPNDPKTRVALALAQMQLGRGGQAMADLEQAASTAPDSYADLALYSARLRSNDPKGALKAAEGLERKMPGKPLPLMLQGQALLAANALADARNRFEKALQADPVHVPAISALAELDIRAGKPAQALARFEALLTREPSNLQAAVAVAELRLRTGQPPEIVSTFLTETIRQHPTDIAPRLVQIDLLLAQRKTEAALSAAQATLTVFPDHAQALDALGKVQLAAGSTEQAISTFRKAAAAFPQDTRPWLRLADAYVGTRNLRAAEQSLRKVLELDPLALAAQRGLIQVALLAKHPDDALKVARAVQTERPSEAIGHVFEGEIQVSLRAWDPALKAFQNALDRGGSTEAAKSTYAVNMKAGRPADADRFAAKWMKDKPADAEFLLYVANQAMERKDYPRAEEHFRALQALTPDSPTPPNNLAWLLVQQGKPGALPLAERAVALLADNAAILDTLGLVLASEKQWTRAVAEQQKAVTKAPAVHEYRLRLAKYLLASGDKAAAREQLQKLVDGAAGHPSQAEARGLLATL